jgi:hypothetical protein
MDLRVTRDDEITKKHIFFKHTAYYLQIFRQTSLGSRRADEEKIE